jgi:TolA-binding protein
VVQPRWPTALEEAEILRGGTGSRPAVETPPANASQGTVSAQDSAVARGAASSQGSAAMQQTTQPPATAFALPQTAAPETESLSGIIETPLPPDVILQRAKDAFDSGNVSSAIALLDQYGKYYPDTDELYWLYGQFYEANSPSRNILLSLDYYRRLVREYPQSSRYNEARGRIAYLERYYINIQ